MVREQVGHQPGQREDGDGDSGQDGQQEIAVDVAPEVGEASFEEEFERRGVDAADRVEEFLVDARDEGDRAARDAGHHVGHAHGAAFQGKEDVAGSVHVFVNVCSAACRDRVGSPGDKDTKIYGKIGHADNFFRTPCRSIKRLSGTTAGESFPFLGITILILRVRKFPCCGG